MTSARKGSRGMLWRMGPFLLLVLILRLWVASCDLAATTSRGRGSSTTASTTTPSSLSGRSGRGDDPGAGAAATPDLFLQLSIRSSHNDPIPQPQQYPHQPHTADNSDVVTVPSCQHHFRQLELINTHPSEQIVIYSVSAGTEETALGADVYTNQRRDINGGEDEKQYFLPTQLHVSRLPGDSLTLGPDEVAIVPLTYLPRFPPQTNRCAGCNSRDNDEDSDWSDTAAPSSSPTLTPSSTTSGSSPLHHSPRREEMSLYEQADWKDWVQYRMQLQALQAPIRSNRQAVARRWQHSSSNSQHQQHRFEEEQETITFSTEIRVETSRGVITAPFRITSVRENDYGLPEAISLQLPSPSSSRGQRQRHPQSGPAPPSIATESVIDDDSGDVDSVWIADRLHATHVGWEGRPDGAGGAPTPSSPRSGNGSGSHEQQQQLVERDCFDVYMHHPHMAREERQSGGQPQQQKGFFAEIVADEIQVMEVLVTVPEWTHVKLRSLAQRAGTSADSLGMDAAPSQTSQPRQAIRAWTESGGPLLVPADGQGHYLVTVCASDSPVPRDTSATIPSEEMSAWTDQSAGSLGFLQVRTDQDTMFVALEQGGESESRWPYYDELSAGQQTRRTISPPFNMTSGGRAVRDGMIWKPNPSPQAVPKSLDVYFLTPEVTTVTASVGIENPSPVEIQVVRAAVAMHAKESFIRTKLGLSISLANYTQPANHAIPAKGMLENSVRLVFAVDWDVFSRWSPSPSLDVKGVLVVRITPGNRDRYLWEVAWTADSQEDPTFALEIPFVVHMQNGSVAVLVQDTTHPFPLYWMLKEWNLSYQSLASAFFPLTEGGSRVAGAHGGKDSTRPQYSVHHQLRVVSDVGVKLNLQNVSVVGPLNNNEGDRGTTLCNRFEARLTEGTRMSSVPEEMDLGLIDLVYQFRVDTARDRSTETTDPFPTTCYLQFMTYVDTGVHRVPLVIYPAKVDVTGGSLPSVLEVEFDRNRNTTGRSSIWRGTVVGFDGMIEWLQMTRLGNALRRALLLSSDSKDDPSLDRTLLQEYLYNVAGGFVNRGNLQPILIRFGAIAQAAIATLPLYVTNYNPVPITIKVLVSEVEGMSLHFGRDTSSRRGDGNNILDYLPRASTARVLRGGSATTEPRISRGRFRGHPVHGLRQFLRSDEYAAEYFNQFIFQDAVSVSSVAIARFPMLRPLFTTYGRGQFYRTRVSRKNNNSLQKHWNQSAYPAVYGSFEKVFAVKTTPAAMIISSDGSRCGLLKSDSRGFDQFKDRPPKSKEIVVPPGGSARFEITIHAPPRRALADDITQFLATGLVMSTNFGELIPVLVSFEALKCRLEVSHINGPSSSDVRDKVIQVPLGLFERAKPNSEKSVVVPARSSRPLSGFAVSKVFQRSNSTDNTGVTLYMRSSFSRNIRLRRLETCNPWFQVDITDDADQTPRDPVLGVKIGSIKSMVPCVNGDEALNSTLGPFPSFFLCALSWVTKQTELQPPGCGPKLTTDGGRDGGRLTESGGLDRLVMAFKNAIAATELQDSIRSLSESSLSHLSFPIKSGKRSADARLSPYMISIITEAWDAWRTVSELGLGVIGTSLRAIVEYNSTKEEKTRIPLGSNVEESDTYVLSMLIPNVSIESSLTIPLLFDSATAQNLSISSVRGNDHDPSIVEFPAVRVGNAVSLRIPLRNPTSVPVRVRLAAASQHEYLSYEGASDVSSRSHFVGHQKPPYVQSKGNPSAAVDDWVSAQWWGQAGGFILPDFEGNLMRSHQNITVRATSGARFSLVNPSITFITAFLAGCGVRCGHGEDTAARKPRTLDEGVADLSARSPIGASAAAGTFLVGRQRTRYEHDRISVHEPTIAACGSLTAGGEGPSAFAIPYSSLDEIILPPYGLAQIGPIIFRPPGRSPFMGCTSFPDASKPAYCASHRFESMIFLENSLTGLERIKVIGEAQWERLVFLDPIADIEPSSFGSIEMRHGRPTLVFSGSATYVRGKGWLPVVKEVVLHNAGDVAVFVNRVIISSFEKEGSSWHTGKVCEAGGFRLMGCNPKIGLKPFELQPGENISLFVQHQPRCNKQRESVSIIVKRAMRRSLQRTFPSTDPPVENSPWFLEVPFAGLIEHEYAEGDENYALLAGYEMTDEDLRFCARPRFGSMPVPQPSTTKFPYDNDKWSQTRRMVVHIFVSMLKLICFVLWGLLLISSLEGMRSQSLNFLGLLNLFQARPSMTGKNWSAAFLCVARADPTSVDLQTLVKERTRQLVLARYRTSGALPPQCINSAGTFHRERIGGASALPRQTADGKVVPPASNVRMRTLSDTIFGNFTSHQYLEAGCLPCRFGWQTALSRGIMDSRSLSQCPVHLMTKELLESRRVLYVSLDDAVAHSFEVSEVESSSVKTVPTPSVGSVTSTDDSQLWEESSEKDIDQSSEKGNNTAINTSSTATQRDAKDDSLLTSKSAMDESSDERVTSLVKPGFEETTVVDEHKASDGNKLSEPLVDGSQVTKVAAEKYADPHDTPTSTSNAVSDDESQQNREAIAELAHSGTIKNERHSKARGKKKTSAGRGSKEQATTAEHGQRPRKKEHPDRVKKPRKQAGPRSVSTPSTTTHIPTTTDAPAVLMESQAVLSQWSPSMRTPPGIAPPPGFVHVYPNDSASPAYAHTGSSTSGAGISTIRNFPQTLRVDVDQYVLPTTPTGLNSLSGSEGPLHVSPPSIDPMDLLSARAATAATEPPAFDSSLAESEFDVMAFLDGILNEGGAMPSDIDSGPVDGLASDSAAAAAAALSANPWATDGAHSRAAAYGIPMEDEASGRTDGLVALRLLTPDAIFAVTTAGEEKDDDKEVKAFYHGLFGD